METPTPKRKNKKYKLLYCYTTFDGTRMAFYEDFEGNKKECQFYIYKKYYWNDQLKLQF
jgi:hypothetical protein